MLLHDKSLYVVVVLWVFLCQALLKITLDFFDPIYSFLCTIKLAFHFPSCQCILLLNYAALIFFVALSEQNIRMSASKDFHMKFLFKFMLFY